ncbi:ABC transporter ATP-binding protein [uncultured Parolsenella sp.]|uniref:ABC transporter ATP-binding protein n=1 Tax=uncultured Parolsenella sp. TaxID=2083008 RepID=UPI0027DDDEF8|nr:ABC transporter ATP-binding protein [uncultured Parolsenella sp.]
MAETSIHAEEVSARPDAVGATRTAETRARAAETRARTAETRARAAEKPTPTDAFVELRDVNKTFGDFQASRHVSFGVARGTLAALLGPSGSGKTTILRTIAGLETPDTGDILIDGRRINDVAPSERGIGFVFQSYALFRYMTVRENVAFGLRVKREPEARVRERVDELLELIDLADLGNRYPGQLSGGQRQRVAFARAIAPSPRVLLLDEPFAAIDAKIRKELRSWLKQTIRRLGITSIFVTHDQEEAIEVADSIILTHAGRIEQVGTPTQIYARPQTKFAAGFFGDSAHVDDLSRLGSFSGVRGPAIVRSEHVSVLAPGEPFRYAASVVPGVVRDVSFRGRSVEVEVDVAGERLRSTRSPEAPDLNSGDMVGVFVHRLFAEGDDSLVRPVENDSLREESVVI